MHEKTLSFLLLFLITACAQARVVHLLPKPQEIVEKKGIHHFEMGRKVTLADPTNCALLREVLENNGCQVEKKAKAHILVRLTDRIDGVHDYTLSGYENEAYRLDVETNSIRIEAITPVGVIRAAQTLQQLAEGYRSRSAIEAVRITDWPAFKIRGFMHDVGRTYIPVEELKRQLQLLSRFKVNTFHMHLTDNQAWRFEVAPYPQLTDATTMTRDAGNYYTQQECRELEEYAFHHGITIIPEIDILSRCAAFRRAMKHPAQTKQSISELKTIMNEIVGTFVHAPYIHLGTDRVSDCDPDLLPAVTDWIHQLGRKTIVRKNNAGDTGQADMVQLGSTDGKKVTGKPNIDSRYWNINHFDVFADLAGIYLSDILYRQHGDEETAGAIVAVWNDHALPSVPDIVRQNNLYANVIASASRAWTGGGLQNIEQRGARLPDKGDELKDFDDWERRFLFHKDHSLSKEPIPYVRQSHVRWQVKYQHEIRSVTGAGIYLRHTWDDRVPALFPKPHPGDTAYAWTHVYSPVEQNVGTLIELQNYSRSEADLVPKYGHWDCKGSRLWLNDVEILAPLWQHHEQRVDYETPLADENFTARNPVILHLEKGWNKVFLKLPYVHVPDIRLNKWMFTFVFTDLEGRRALDFDYQPSLAP